MIKTILSIIAAAVSAIYIGIALPDYSAPSDKVLECGNIRASQMGRRVNVYDDGKLIWSLPDDVYAQDILLGDIDHDEDDELLVLCWKRGRFGAKRPTWVKEDEKSFSQHIFIYETDDGQVRPKWMASDIGMKAASWNLTDGVLSIKDTDGELTKWVWLTWGLEKL